MNARTHKLTAALIAGLVAAGSAYASPRGGIDGFTTQVRVLSSSPVYETLNEPRRVCWTETIGHERTSMRDGNNTGGAIIGAIAGGLIGSTVGSGDGKVAAAAVGAATGAVIGDRWRDGEYRHESRPRQIERCQVHDNFRQALVGYDVRYRFQDREFTTRLPYDPGRWLTLNVSFNVAENSRDGWKSSRGHGKPGRDWDD